MAKNDFNPVKDEKDSSKAKRMIWTTNSLNMALKGIEQGKRLIANPFYENNTKLLKGDLVFERTKEEVKEWLKCKNDILYFAEKYCKLMTPEGIKHIYLRDYQKKYLKHLEENRLSIYLACRQCSKTTMSSIFMLHYICFNIDKNALVLGNKRKTAVEILDKSKKIFLELPYFLRPGIYKWNEGEIVLDNGCRLMAEATTINSGISFTFHCVLSDEFAHISPTIMDKFYNNLFPTITAGKARFMITSTQNGYNLFYRLYKAAEAGENEYKSFKTDWWEVPEWNPEKKCWEKRDEAWHKMQVANYGSEEAFNAQFGTNFDISACTLINQKVLSVRQMDLKEFVHKDLYGIVHSDYFFWDPYFDPMDQLRHCYLVMTTDLADGVEQDSTVCKIWRMIEPGSNKLECVGYFKCNCLSRDLCAFAIQQLICMYCNQDRVLLSWEKNTYGDIFYNEMLKNIDNDEYNLANFDQSLFVRYYNETETKYVHGIKLTPGNKTPHCILFKESYESKNIIDDSSQFMNELSNFTNDGSNHFKASFGHDDMVMAAVQLEFVKKTSQYKILRDEFNEGNSQVAENIYNPFEEININEDPEKLLYNRLNKYSNAYGKSA